MLNSIYTKTIYSLRWSIVGWSGAMIFIAFITIALYDAFSVAGIEQLVASVPDSLKSLVGTAADFKTIPGFIGQQIFGPNLMMIAIAMAIIIAISVSASEEDAGRLQSLLTLPVTRSAVYFQKWLGVITVLGIICLSVILALWLGLLIIGQQADYVRILQSILALWLLSVAFSGVTFATSMATGKKSLTVVVASGYAFASFIITSLAPAITDLKAIDALSLTHYYNTPQIMTHGIDTENLWITVAIITSLTVIGWIGFLRRDVRS